MKMTIEEYNKIKGNPPKKTNKFNAQKTEYNGVIFDSKKEAARAQELDMLKRAGEIIDVEYQPRFNCVINGKKVFLYKADFRNTYSDGSVEVEDVKGYKHGAAYELFRIKKKVVEALFNVEIIEI